MRFLADACVPRRVIEQLRADGHDVTRAAAGAKDELILAAAFEERRVVVSEDLDFGKLAFADRMAHAGVLLLRMSELTPDARALRTIAVIVEIGDRLQTSFVVVEADRVRISESPA